MVLALAMIPLLLAPLMFRLSGSAEKALLTVDTFIWAIFTIDYVTRVYLSARRWHFIRTHIPDLVVVVVPMLRPLRILRSTRVLRVLRLARLGAFVTRGIREVRAVLRSRGLNYVLLIGVALVFIAAGLMREFESDAEGANVKSYADALWWAATTVTTVGYGDRFPVTAGGRGVAVFLMVTGIALFGVLTATIAAYFVEEKEPSQVDRRLEEVTQRLVAIEAQLRSVQNRSGPSS